MNRRQLLKNALVAIAVSLVPEILQPTAKWIAGDKPTLPNVHLPGITYIIVDVDGKVKFVCDENGKRLINFKWEI